MPTRYAAARVPDELTAAVRQARPELADASASVLIRAGLAVLAGYGPEEAISKARGAGATWPVLRDYQPQSARTGPGTA